jgi:fatty-acyl-CoA synthase
MSTNIYELGLERRDANFAALTPLSFIVRTAEVYPSCVSVIHGARSYTWRETYDRCVQLASALRERGIGPGDTVSTMLSNTPEMFEAHFGVPMSGAILNAINTRLDADAVAFILRHAETKVLFTDREFSGVVAAALQKLDKKPLVIDVLDSEYQGPGERLSELDYEQLLKEGDCFDPWDLPDDEWNAISLNYTSGTTGNPKGVVYHHRGAYLTAVNNALTCDMERHCVYLWTLPMFHCNGWCFPWTLAARAGVNVCLRKVEPAAVFAAMRDYNVTHYCGAPIVHTMLIDADESLKRDLPKRVNGVVGGAAPSMSMVEGMRRLGFELTHVYGLTEVYGPSSVCEKQRTWNDLSVSNQVERNARQGVRCLLTEGMTVVNSETMEPVPADGRTMGEIVFRGNLTMKGYLKNAAATEEAFRGGWFHSGDLAVLDPDGYVKIKDRAKDIIISGGENISTLEVEDALYRHPAVLLVGVVAQPDARWGESPCAFIELKPGSSATEAEIIAFCRDRIAHFKAPKRVVFGAIPKTSTGKIQKFVLREKAKALAALG